jgi:DNA modification methylase
MIQADARNIPLADKSVHCCVTSPPYWGLRDYGTAKWEGGSSSCDHQVPIGRRGGNAVGTKQTTNPGSYGYREWLVCGKCGAERVDQQIGLEKTPEEYIAQMVQVFREVKRVLRDDGTLWLNLGDSYAGSGNGWQKDSGSSIPRKWLEECRPGGDDGRPAGYISSRQPNGLKPKDLIGIPWMLAFALRSDGWYLRSDIIWSKPNPMPESVTDRPTKAHEYIFLLSKSERYYYDPEAIAEKSISGDTRKPYGPGQVDSRGNGHDRGGGSPRKQDETGNRRYTGFNERWDASEDVGEVGITRNKRTVWEVSPQPFPEAHFATFPEELIKPCILAGCPAGGTVLDPFMGSGTTALVARNLQCNAVGLELNPAYIEIAKRRLAQKVMEFA